MLVTSIALGAGAVRTYVEAREAWLAASDTASARYDAAASDALYDTVTTSLDEVVLLARVLGAGLVLLAAGLAFRAQRETSRAALLLGLTAATLTWALLAFAAGRFSHPLFGPIVTHGLHALAPFAALAAGITVWALRGRRSAAKVPASGETT